MKKKLHDAESKINYLEDKLKLTSPGIDLKIYYAEVEQALNSARKSNPPTQRINKQAQYLYNDWNSKSKLSIKAPNTK